MVEEELREHVYTVTGYPRWPLGKGDLSRIVLLDMNPIRTPEEAGVDLTVFILNPTYITKQSLQN